MCGDILQVLVSRNGSRSRLIHPLQDHPPLQKDNIATDTVKETENIVTEIETLIIGTLVTVTTRKTIETATGILAAVGTRVRLSLPPRLVTTPTLEGSGAVGVTNTTGTGRETMIVGTEMDTVEEGGALIAIVITLPLAMCTIPRGNIQRGEGGTVAVAMATAAGRREEDMEAIEVVGGAVGVVTGDETGAGSLRLEVSVYYVLKS